MEKSPNNLFRCWRDENCSRRHIIAIQPYLYGINAVGSPETIQIIVNHIMTIHFLHDPLLATTERIQHAVRRCAVPVRNSTSMFIFHKRTWTNQIKILAFFPYFIAVRLHARQKSQVRVGSWKMPIQFPQQFCLRYRNGSPSELSQNSSSSIFAQGSWWRLWAASLNQIMCFINFFVNMNI